MMTLNDTSTGVMKREGKGGSAKERKTETPDTSSFY